MTQITEAKTRNSLKQYKSVYVLKLQINSFSHTTSPADYLVISKDRTIFLECKQVTKGKRFDKDRLTQEQDLLYYESFFNDDFHKSFVLINFWNSTAKNSHAFLLNIKDYLRLKNNSKNKKSITLKEFLESKTELNVLKGGFWDLQKIFWRGDKK